MSARHKRQQELWQAEMMSRTRWKYSTAVLWVAFLSLEKVAEWCGRPELADLKREGGAVAAANAIEEAVSQWSAEHEVAEVLPWATLDLALKEGRVLATGELNHPFPYAGMGRDERTVLDRHVWEDFTPVPWVRSPYDNKEHPLDANLELVPRGWKRRITSYTDHPSHYWTGVEIDRRSLLTAFPPPSPNRMQLWWPSTKDLKGYWARRDGPADQAARERLITQGAANPPEAHVCEELAAMWNEARPDDPTTGPSLVTMRHRKS